MTTHCLFAACLAVAALGCSRTLIIYESENGRCEIDGEATADEVIAACGVPDGLRWQAKTGTLLPFEICSAPAYLYGPVAITFGCDGRPAAILSSDDGSLLQESLDDVLSQASSGRHVAAAFGELRYRKYSTAERDRVAAVAEIALRSGDATIRRAASKTLAALASTVPNEKRPD